MGRVGRGSGRVGAVGFVAGILMLLLRGCNLGEAKRMNKKSS